MEDYREDHCATVSMIFYSVSQIAKFRVETIIQSLAYRGLWRQKFITEFWKLRFHVWEDWVLGGPNRDSNTPMVRVGVRVSVGIGSGALSLKGLARWL